MASEKDTTRDPRVFPFFPPSHIRRTTEREKRTRDVREVYFADVSLDSPGRDPLYGRKSTASHS